MSAELGPESPDSPTQLTANETSQALSEPSTARDARGMKLYRLVMLGDEGVGKTALTLQLCVGHFSEGHELSSGDVYRKQVTTNKQSYMLEIADMPADLEDDALCTDPDWHVNSYGFLLVYDVCSRSSLSRIEMIGREIKSMAEKSREKWSLTAPPQTGSPLTTAFILVGNKTDAVSRRVVSTEEGEALARELGCAFVETSAKEDKNVKKAFEDIAQDLKRQNAAVIRRDVSRQPRLLSRQPWKVLPKLMGKFSGQQQSSDPQPGPWQEDAPGRLGNEALSRLYASLQSLVPLYTSPKSGYRRLKWTCSCGKYMWGDFDSSNPQAVEQLAHELQQLGQAGDMASGPSQDKGNPPANAPANGSSSDPRGYPTESQQPSSTNENDRSGPSQDASQPSGSSKSSFFELCVNAGKHAIRLGEINISTVQSDGELFDKIWQQYKSICGGGLRGFFARPRDIHFVYFGVHHRNLAGIYKKPLDIPPKWEVEGRRYHYHECPLETLPPMPANVFLHYLYCASKKKWDERVPGIHKDAFFLRRLPKKVNGSIYETSPVSQELGLMEHSAAYGWGVHILEGPNHEALSWALTIGIFVSFLVSILCIGIARTQEQGFGVGQWVIAVAACIMTALYFRLADE